MKQPEDDKTVDMYGVVEKWAPVPATKRYVFYVETVDGAALEWRGLTIAQAKNMNAYTRKNTPDNVKRFGWEETK